MAGVTFDPAKKLPLYFRVARDGSKTINFANTSGGNFDISGNTYRLRIYDQPGGNLILDLTESSELSKPTNYQLTITVTDTLTSIRPREYYYILDKTDGSSLIKTWLNGPCYFHEGEFDGLTNTTSSVVIDESGTGVTLTISDTASPTEATQAQVNTGTATGSYVSPAKLNDLDSDSVALVDGATIDLTGPKHTLTTANGRTFTISHAGDFIAMRITLNATSATFTFPAMALCSFAGTASGDNTLVITGATSGDKIDVGILKFGSDYSVVAQNMGQ